MFNSIRNSLTKQDDNNRCILIYFIRLLEIVMKEISSGLRILNLLPPLSLTLPSVPKQILYFFHPSFYPKLIQLYNLIVSIILSNPIISPYYLLFCYNPHRRNILSLFPLESMNLQFSLSLLLSLLSLTLASPLTITDIEERGFLSQLNKFYLYLHFNNPIDSLLSDYSVHLLLSNSSCI